MKPLALIPLLLACTACAAQLDLADWPMPCAGIDGSAGARGTSTTFCKRLELMTGDSFRAPPLAPATAVKNLARYEAIWCAQLVARYNPPAWKLLREQRANTLALCYVCGATAGADDFTYWATAQMMERDHPEWFVRADMRRPPGPDNRVRWSLDPDSPYYQRYFFDVVNPAFQDWAVTEAVRRVGAGNYSGLAVDNVGLGQKFAALMTSRHPHWQYADRPTLWTAGWCVYLGRLHRALQDRRAVLIVNASLHYLRDDDRLAWSWLPQFVDGLLSEEWLRRYSDDFADARWLHFVQSHAGNLNKDLLDWWVCYPSDDEQFRYNYCSWLLVRQPGRSFFYATRGEPGWSNPCAPWYAEYDLPLGEPKSARYRLNNCWARRYAHALVIVNPTRQMQVVRLDANSKWIDALSGKPAAELHLPATCGRIIMEVRR